MLSSPSLLRWANVSNLKAAAHAYASINKIKDIEEAISEKMLLIKETKSSLVELEKKMKTASEILHYAELYKDNLRYHNAMLRSKDLESALSTLNEYIGKGGAESMQSHVQEESHTDDKTQSKKDQSL